MKTSNRWLTTFVVCLFVAGACLGDAAEARKSRKPPTSAKAESKEKQESEGVVNINTATVEQIQLLPGIGPSKAKAIVKYRTKQKFKATYWLIRVRGIGRKTYRKLRPFLTVKGPTTLSKKPRPKD